MWSAIKRLLLGVVLIALASSLLIVSDLKSRTGARARIASERGSTFHLALMQHATQPVLEQGLDGIMDALRERGFAEGQNLFVRRYNAEGDVATAAAIAREITTGHHDLIVTVSTMSLQAVANANRAGKTRHVFAVVTDPFGAGVGISRENPLDHPPHLAGFGTMQPVEECFRLARQVYPGLQSAGVVWNPAESNSEANVLLARKVCADLGIKLLEAAVDNSSGVLEAANALVARGVDALWIGGDSTVLVAADAMVQAGKGGRIPVFTVIPTTVDNGALFDLGANYYTVGKLAGDLAADVLEGLDTRTVAIDNRVPEMLAINKRALAGLKDPWRLPPALVARADLVIDDDGRHEKAPARADSTAANRPLSRKWQLRLIEYNDVLDVEEAEHGILDGLKKAGLVEGRDYEIRILNAQGDMATVSGLIDAAVTDGADLLLTLSTPTLQAALRRAPANLPIVFTYVASGVAAGAGSSEANHLPNVTGIQTAGAYDAILRAAQECIPNLRRVGTLFVPSEVNTVYHKDQVTAAAKKLGIEVIAVPAETNAEVPDAALALTYRDIQAITQIPGNLTAASFPSIARAAISRRIPLFASQSAQAETGAAVVVARDYYEAGIETAALAARIMRGESPSGIPIQTASETKLIVNLPAARALGMTLPPAMIQRADRVIGQ